MCILVDGMMSKSPRRYNWDAIGGGQVPSLAYDRDKGGRWL